eukprot:5701006-Lingulodinium_polyedra.AAC.1
MRFSGGAQSRTKESRSGSRSRMCSKAAHSHQRWRSVSLASRQNGHRASSTRPAWRRASPCHWAL